MSYTEIIDRDLPKAINMSVLFENGEAIMREFMQTACDGLDNPRIAEVGTNVGVSASILSDYGEVHTFDIKLDSQFNKVTRLIGNPKNITRHVALADELRETIAEMGPFDIAHIDGSHSYGSVCADYEALKDCKAILFHDYSPTGGGRSQVGVNRFIDELDGVYVLAMEPFAAVFTEKARV